MTSVLGVGVRAGVLILLVAAVLGVAVVMTDPDEGANIGAGLIAFAVLVVVSAVWGFFDGRRRRDLRSVLLVWLAVAAVVGLAVVLTRLVIEPGGLSPVLLLDAVFSLAMVAAIVLVPAAVGGAIGTGSTTP